MTEEKKTSGPGDIPSASPNTSHPRIHDPALNGSPLHHEASAGWQPPVALDEVVADIPSWRKWIILFTTCWMALPVSFWSTSLLPVTEEISAAFGVQPTTINIVNAGVFVAQASSALIWLPISTIVGRRTSYLMATIFMALCSIGVALAPNMGIFTAFWVMGGTACPFFLVSGQTILADIFEPVVRGTAVGFFLGSCVSSNSIAPMMGSIIATFTSWRVIVGVQGGMSLVGFALSFVFIPRAKDLGGKIDKQQGYKGVRETAMVFNPMAVFRQFKYLNILLSNLACGFLSFNQYGLLSSVRRVINPRFNLSSPLDSGLFFLAPGAGFLLGSLAGGRVSDAVVRRYKNTRKGERIAEDRLRSSYPWVFVVLPAGTLLYGWAIDKKFGGLALPIISAFVQGIGLMASFSSLNTYAAEAMPERRTATISGKYVIQYSFGAGSVGGLVPLINAVGPGWAFTATAASAFAGGVCILVVTRPWARRPRKMIP